MSHPDLEKTDSGPRGGGHVRRGNRWGPYYHTAAAGAGIAGVFSAIVCVMLIVNHFKSTAADPLDTDPFRALKAQLRATPADQDDKQAQLKKTIRAEDLRLRREYFQRQDFSRRGVYLLVGGLVAFFACLKAAADIRSQARSPRRRRSKVDRTRQERRLARLAVAVLAVALGTAGALAGRFWAAGHPPAAPGESLGTLPQAPPSAPASDEEFQRNWPSFRGMGGAGISTYANAPDRWDGKTGAGVLWKSQPVPLEGEGSPVVWGKRVFLTGATKDKREVYCYDADSGRLLWQRPVVNVPGSPAEPPEVAEDAGYAASTPATDGRRVYAIFANGDLICFDSEGTRLWAKNLDKPDNQYGHAASLAIWRDVLIVQFDQGQRGDENKSSLIGIDASTGGIKWRTPRPVPNSWASPIVIESPGGPQIITCGKPWVIAYDPPDGRERWRVRCLDGDVAPSPTYAGGLVVAAVQESKVTSIRPDGHGDVTATHVAWTAEDGLPDISSPLATGKLVYLLNTGGTLTCYSAGGKKLYEKELDVSFRSSPALAGGKVYLLSESGVMVIVQAGEAYQELGRCELGEGSNCCPAFQDGRIYIRGKKHLYCIGK